MLYKLPTNYGKLVLTVILSLILCAFTLTHFGSNARELALSQPSATQSQQRSRGSISAESSSITMNRPSQETLAQYEKIGTTSEGLTAVARYFADAKYPRQQFLRW